MRFRRLLLPLFATAIVVTHQARAYDEDTHFYATYAMARYSGIRHEVAARIALGAQWMDESYISDPTSMILFPLTGLKKRRLLHFPSSRDVGSLFANTQKEVLGFEKVTRFEEWAGSVLTDFTGSKIDLETLNLRTETAEDHPLASEMLMEGLKTGNLMEASVGIHTLQDSFAHAGTPAEEGHSGTWHWPDRPFASPEKYLRMVKSVFHALTAIRTLLPPEARDCSVRIAPIPDTRPNCEIDGNTLGDNYGHTAAVVAAMSEDIMKNPEYVQFAVRDFLGRARKIGYLQISDTELNEIANSVPKDGKVDSYGAVGLVIKKMVKSGIDGGPKQMDLASVLSDMNYLKAKPTRDEILDYLDSYSSGRSTIANNESGSETKQPSDGVDNFVRLLCIQLLRWNVPVPLSDTHRMETELDASPIRAKEMELRVAGQQRLIQELFGNRIQLVNNTTKDADGFAKEIEMNPASEPKLPKEPGVYFATYGRLEKNRFDHMIFTYLFPSLSPNDLENLVDKFAQVVSARANNKGLYPLRVAQAFFSIRGIAPVFFKDLVESRMTPRSDDFYYRNPRLFGRYVKDGVVKPFFGPHDVWKLQSLIDETKAQAEPDRRL